jgi:hypothetical protein
MKNFDENKSYFSSKFEFEKHIGVYFDVDNLYDILKNSVPEMHDNLIPENMFIFCEQTENKCIIIYNISTKEEPSYVLYYMSNK